MSKYNFDEHCHLFFDVETLGLYENAVVLSLACVPFYLNKITSAVVLADRGFYVKFDADEQIKTFGRKTDKSTLEWWKKQSEDAKKISVTRYTTDQSLRAGLTKLSDFIEQSEYDPKNSFVWSRGNYFDFPKIESLYREVGLPMPYNGWMIRDARTFFDLLGDTTGNGYVWYNKPQSLVKHHALHDAAFDAWSMTKLYKDITTPINEGLDDDIPF